MVQGWTAADAVQALLAVTAASVTHSPARLSCPGPWRDAVASAGATAARDDAEAAELAQLEAWLAEADGARVALQRQARRELGEAGEPLTRLNVAGRTCQLFLESDAASVLDLRSTS